MRALVCHRWGDVEDLRIEDVPVPELRPGCVRLQVAYAGLNFALSLFVAGKYQVKPPLPFVPGFDVTGTVTEVAAGITRIKPGDRVIAILDWGGFAESAVVPEETVYPLPPELDLQRAVCLPTSYGTAYGALAWRARVRPGETLLVHGAAGAIGLAAVELGRQLGARVIACASTEEKRAVALARGAEVALPSAGFREKVRALTDGRGVDLVFDPVGGDVFDQSLRTLALEGRILTMGFASGRIPQIPANILLVKNISVLGFNYGTYAGWGPRDERRIHAPRMQTMMSTLIDWMRSDRIQPRVSHCFELSQFAEAMRTVLQRKNAGKVALRIAAPGRGQRDGESEAALIR